MVLKAHSIKFTNQKKKPNRNKSLLKSYNLGDLYVIKNMKKLHTPTNKIPTCMYSDTSPT